jgi:hypothetical protein
MALLQRRFIFVLDGFLAAILLLVLAPRFTGLALHEWLGLVLVPPLLLHLLFSWDWIRQGIREFFTAASPRRRVNFVLNTLLFILLVLEVISGVFISHVALRPITGQVLNDRSWRMLHNEFLGWLRLVTGFHVAMNWSWIAASVRRWRTAMGMQHIGEAGFLAWVGRLLAILAAGLLVGALAFWRLGPPSAARQFHQDEVAAFAGAYRMGVFQVLSQVFLLAMVAYIGRRWLRIRL